MKITNPPGPGHELGRPDPSDRDAFDAWAADLAGITVQEWRNRRRTHDERRSDADQDLDAIRVRIIARLNGTSVAPVHAARTTRTAKPTTTTTTSTTTRSTDTPAARRATTYGVRR